ncbi:MAG TPA: hypothetical protein EYP22_06425 [Methanosarcinales archaeon]|nr:hypothetical protein [Methanosarcinales archaeon]
MNPTVACTATESKDFVKDIEAVNEEYGCSAIALEGSDLYEMQETLQEIGGSEVLIGTSKAKDLAEDENMPLVRVGFPIYERVGYYRYPVIGYNCSIRLLDQITNAILDFKYDQDKLHQ